MASETTKLDLSEKGRGKDGQTLSLNRRLFMQFLAFGNCGNSSSLIDVLKNMDVMGVLYADMNDAQGIGLLTLHEDPNFFVNRLRSILNRPPFTEITPKAEYTMLGRTYSIGYEPDLEAALINRPTQKVLNPETPWAIWYPLRRVKTFETLPETEQRRMLGEHGNIGRTFGEAGYATDIRLACHGLDKYDNDFVVGLLGRDLHPLSAVVQTMRKTKQTSQYLESLGPFFIGKAIWQSSV